MFTKITELKKFKIKMSKKLQKMMYSKIHGPHGGIKIWQHLLKITLNRKKV